MLAATARGGAALALLLLVACGSLPRATPGMPPAPAPTATPVPATAAIGARLAAVAVSQLGAPYRYGGASQDGFDCSGLVFYAHAALGLRVPRTVAAQSAAARPVPPGGLAVGDLVFFGLHRALPDHVGIYLGEGRFVHAPARGRTVRIALLADPYYAARYVGAGRLWGRVDAAAGAPPGSGPGVAPAPTDVR